MSVGVMEAEMGTTRGIPNTPKRFAKWLEKQKAELPANLYLLGQKYGMCLTMVEINRNNRDALAAANRIGAPEMKEFMTAYANWSKSRA